jgi:hypothetical protein
VAKRRTKEELAQPRDFQRAFEQRSLDALRAGSFLDAIKPHVEYEASQPTSRGMGIDWKNYGLFDHDMKLFTHIFNGRPQVLSSLSEEHLGHLRVAACMNWMWGPRYMSEWVPPGLDEQLKDGLFMTVNQMMSFGVFKTNMDEWQQDTGNITLRVKYHNCNDQGVCRACRALGKHLYSIEEAPELPYAKCTSDGGCRCSSGATMD